MWVGCAHYTLKGWILQKLCYEGSACALCNRCPCSLRVFHTHFKPSIGSRNAVTASSHICLCVEVVDSPEEFVVLHPGVPVQCALFCTAHFMCCICSGSSYYTRFLSAPWDCLSASYLLCPHHAVRHAQDRRHRRQCKTQNKEL